MGSYVGCVLVISRSKFAQFESKRKLTKHLPYSPPIPCLCQALDMVGRRRQAGLLFGHITSLKENPVQGQGTAKCKEYCGRKTSAGSHAIFGLAVVLGQHGSMRHEGSTCPHGYWKLNSYLILLKRDCTHTPTRKLNKKSIK